MENTEQKQISKEQTYEKLLSTDYSKLYDLVANKCHQIVVFVDYRDGYSDVAVLKNHGFQLSCSARGITYFDFYHNKEYLETHHFLPEKNSFEGKCKMVNLKFIDIERVI
jgi:hypothetical protein